jgi:hypothetical protein
MKTLTLKEVHKDDAYFEDSRLIGKEFIPAETSWDWSTNFLPDGYLNGEYELVSKSVKLSDGTIAKKGEVFSFWAVKFE